MDGPLRLPGFLDGAAASLQPERRLMLAVLEGAVCDFQKYATASSGRGRRLFAEADAWLRSSAAAHPFDFENICHALDLDPSFIRSGLQRWRIDRRQDASPSKSVLRFPFRRVSGTRHAIVAVS